jgi:hypothetical protein
MAGTAPIGSERDAKYPVIPIVDAERGVLLPRFGYEV